MKSPPSQEKAVDAVRTDPRVNVRGSTAPTTASNSGGGDSCAADPRQGYDLPPHSCFPTNVADTVWCFEHPNTTIIDCLTEKDRRIKDYENDVALLVTDQQDLLEERDELKDQTTFLQGELFMVRTVLLDLNAQNVEARKALRRMLHVAETHGCKGERCCDWTVEARRVLSKGEGK